MIFENENNSSYNSIGILSKMCEFINKNSDYEVDKEEMKYLLAYMHTHEYLLGS